MVVGPSPPSLRSFFHLTVFLNLRLTRWPTLIVHLRGSVPETGLVNLWISTVSVLLLDTLWSTRQQTLLLETWLTPVLRLRLTLEPLTTTVGTALEWDLPLSTRDL